MLVIDQQLTITTANIGVEAEVKQLENILEDLKDKWFLEIHLSNFKYFDFSTI